MKRQLTLLAGLLAVLVAIGAAAGFVRRRVERLEQSDGSSTTNGSVPTDAVDLRRTAGVNGDRS